MRIALLLLILAVAATPARAEAENPFSISGRPARDMALIQDCRALDVVAIAGSKEVWAVVEFALDPGSNIPLGRMVPETGPDAKLVTTVFVKGTCKVLAKVTGDCGKDEWAFEWVPTFFRGGTSARATPRKVLRRSIVDGVMLVRIDPKAEGEAQFPEAYELVDKSWAAYAKEAADRIRAHPDWFEPSSAARNKDELARMAIGDNPLLALTSFRLLNRMAVADASIVQEALAKATGPAQALMLQTSLEQVDPQDAETAYAPIRAAIMGATTVEEIEGLVAGATYASNPAKNGPNLAARVIGDAEKRLPDLKGSDEVRQCVDRLIAIHKLSAAGKPAK